MERQITIDNGIATLHPWIHDQQEKVIDYTEHVNTLQQELAYLNEVSRDQQLIIIEGRSGSGKTCLAKTIAAEMENAEYTNPAESEGWSTNTKIDASHLFQSAKKLYLIDEVHYFDEQSLQAAIQNHLSARGAVILFTQYARTLIHSGFDLSVRTDKLSFFILTRESLKKVSWPTS